MWVIGDGGRDGHERTFGQVLLALNLVWVGVGGRPIGEFGSPGCSYHVWHFRGVAGHRKFWSIDGKHRSVVLFSKCKIIYMYRYERGTRKWGAYERAHVN